MSEQKELKDILDGIDKSDGWTLSMLIETNSLLVKALRRAMEYAWAARMGQALADITAILNGEEEKQDSGEQGAEITKDGSKTDGV